MEKQKYIQLENESGIRLDDKKREKFDKFYEILVETNKYMNLTGITEYDEVLSKHFFDSLTCFSGLDDWDNKKVIDVGTGAGFPGMPLKIANSSLKITLLDSLNKRINFLKEVASELELLDIDFIHGRAEDYGQNNDYREQYDIAVSRAVANLSVLCEYVMPFIKVGGYFISQKSLNIDEELNNSKGAIELLGGKIQELKEVKVAGTDIVHTLVVIKKIKKTPKKYPRKAGTPAKKPL